KRVGRSAWQENARGRQQPRGAGRADGSSRAGRGRPRRGPEDPDLAHPPQAREKLADRRSRRIEPRHNSGVNLSCRVRYRRSLALLKPCHRRMVLANFLMSTPITTTLTGPTEHFNRSSPPDARILPPCEMAGFSTGTGWVA